MSRFAIEAGFFALQSGMLMTRLLWPDDIDDFGVSDYDDDDEVDDDVVVLVVVVVFIQSCGHKTK